MAEFFKSKFKSLVRRAAVPLNAHTVLGAMYAPTRLTEERPGKLTWHRPAVAPIPPGQSFALPPTDLRMGYGDDDADYLSIGARTAGMLRGLLNKTGVTLGAGTRAMDWGCASGRVLRQFEPEVRAGCEFWGVDQDGPHVDWCKQALNPPFKFGTCSAYPHLPFEDNSFNFVYAISVFTHLVHLMDAWLLELRRVLAPGGVAILTIHDEHTMRFFKENPGHTPRWMAGQDAGQGLTGDLVLHVLRADWGHTFTFFGEAHVRKEWGMYFDVVAYAPLAEVYQTAVVVRKAGR